MFKLFDGWTRNEFLALAGIIVSSIIAVAIFLLQKRLSDKQKLDHRLEVEEKTGKKLREMEKGHSRKIQLYNAKLLNRRSFTSNKRSRIWGYPFHGAEFYGANFDGLEFVVSLEEWNKKKYYKIGLIPYGRVLGMKPEGDGSFNGLIFYVKPYLIQKGRYSIAYKSFRYYIADDAFAVEVNKPVVQKIIDTGKNTGRRIRYLTFYKWKFLYLKRKYK